MGGRFEEFVVVKSSPTSRFSHTLFQMISIDSIVPLSVSIKCHELTIISREILTVTFCSEIKSPWLIKFKNKLKIGMKQVQT